MTEGFERTVDVVDDTFVWVMKASTVIGAVFYLYFGVYLGLFYLGGFAGLMVLFVSLMCLAGSIAFDYYLFRVRRPRSMILGVSGVTLVLRKGKFVPWGDMEQIRINGHGRGSKGKRPSSAFLSVGNKTFFLDSISAMEVLRAFQEATGIVPRPSKGEGSTTWIMTPLGGC